MGAAHLSTRQEGLLNNSEHRVYILYYYTFVLGFSFRLEEKPAAQEQRQVTRTL